MRNQAGVIMPDVNEDFVAIAIAGRGGTPTSLMQQIAAPGTFTSIRCPREWQRVFVNRDDVTPEWHHPDAGGVFQEFTDSAISKDLQLSTMRPEEYVGEDLPLRQQAGCKGGQ